MKTNYISIIVMAVFLVSTVAGCRSAPPSSHRGHGPPPHAPAHGHRHKHSSGVGLVFDSGLGVYAVVGKPGYYFQNDQFYRLIGSSWEVSVSLSGPWRVSTNLPPGLAKKGKVPPGKSKKNKNGKKRGKK